MPKTLMLKLISLKGIIIIPITKIMVIDFLTMAEVVVVMGGHGGEGFWVIYIGF